MLALPVTVRGWLSMSIPERTTRNFTDIPSLSSVTHSYQSTLTNLHRSIAWRHAFKYLFITHIIVCTCMCVCKSAYIWCLAVCVSNIPVSLCALYESLYMRNTISSLKIIKSKLLYKRAIRARCYVSLFWFQYSFDCGLNRLFPVEFCCIDPWNNFGC